MPQHRHSPCLIRSAVAGGDVPFVRFARTRGYPPRFSVCCRTNRLPTVVYSCAKSHVVGFRACLAVGEARGARLGCAVGFGDCRGCRCLDGPILCAHRPREVLRLRVASGCLVLQFSRATHAAIWQGRWRGSAACRLARPCSCARRQSMSVRRTSATTRGCGVPSFLLQRRVHSRSVSFPVGSFSSNLPITLIKGMSCRGGQGGFS